MSLAFQWNLQTGPAISGVDPDRFGPGSIELTDGGQSVRRPIDLVADTWTVVDVTGVTPWIWILFNLHASTDVDVAFGGVARMDLEAGGMPCMWTGSDIPSIRASGAAGKVLLICIEK